MDLESPPTSYDFLPSRIRFYRSLDDATAARCVEVRDRIRSVATIRACRGGIRVEGRKVEPRVLGIKWGAGITTGNDGGSP
jgi:hypothetical protein